MAARPHEREGTSLELPHRYARPVTAASPRRVRPTRRARTPRRAALSSLGLLAAALAVLMAGGALVSRANGSPSAADDPLANAVRAVGGAPALGPATGMRVNADLVSIAATPSGRGYWIAAADGGVFAFGDARFAGSVAGRALAAPIVGIAAAPTGNGYWLVGSDGGVFAFGDAAFHGSLGNPAPLISPIVAVAASPSGKGYWLVGSDGGVFSFGDAAFEGSASSFAHGARIVAVAPTPSGYGYYLLGADGGVFAFGDAHFAGSPIDGHRLAAAIAVPRNGEGYEIAFTDGSVVGLGGARSIAATADPLSAQHPVVGFALAGRRGRGAWLETSFGAAKTSSSASPSQDPFLKCTRAHESDSAGGYHAVSPGGVYRGAYQFLRSTWNNVARAAGRPDLVGVDPAAASTADQDQLALFLFHQAGPAPWGGRCRSLH
jgi:Transglycosylase-like domain